MTVLCVHFVAGAVCLLGLNMMHAAAQKRLRSENEATRATLAADRVPYSQVITMHRNSMSGLEKIEWIDTLHTDLSGGRNGT